jgi:hypothetical protein
MDIQTYTQRRRKTGDAEATRGVRGWVCLGTRLWKGDRRKLKGGGGSGVLSPIQRAKIKKGSVDIKNHFFLSSYAKNYFFFYGLSVSRESLKNIPYLSRKTFARLVEQQDCVDLSKLNYNEIIKTMSLTTTITTTAAI